MSDVVDLCDSSDDEEDRQISPPAGRSGDFGANDERSNTTTSVAASTQKASSSRANGVIDLLNDSSDDESVEKMTASAAKRPRIQDSHVLLPQKVPPNPYLKVKKKPVASPVATVARISEDDDDLDSSDDDFIHKYPPAPFSNKKTVVSATNASLDSKPPAVSTGKPQAILLGSACNTARDSSILQSTESVTCQVAQNDERRLIYPTIPAFMTYSDIRPRLAIGLWKIMRKQECNPYLKMGLHAVNDDLATTVLAAHPIRSLEEFCFRKDDAGEINDSNETKLERLKEQLRNVGWESLATPPLQNKYYTIIEACLVAMATEIERRITSRASMSADNIVSQLSRKELWISLEDLIPAIDGLLWDQCPGRLTIQGHSDHGAAHHLNSRPTTAEFQQVKVLEKQLLYDESACIKEHSINKKIYYELSSVGYKRAREIQRRNFPAANGYYYRSLLETTLQVDEKFQGFCIAVDDREGGGTDNKAFHDMMNWIQLPKAAYFVGRLPVGDFWIFTSTEENPEVMDRLLPIFFERKTLADFVDSMKDSRLEYQPVGMRKARHVVGYESSRGVIIVEGMFEKATTKDGFVGQSEHGVKKDDILKKIDQLKSNGFEFIFSPSREHTMLMFPLWAQKAVQDFHSGRTKARLTYEQFIQEFNQVTDEDIVACTKLSGPPEIDWSLTSPLVAPDTGRQESDYRTQDGRWSKTALSKECEARGIQAKSKTMDIMISRLVGPRPPPLIAERMKADIYCPEHDGSASALLVALYLHETTNTSTDGMTKADLIVKAAYLFISESFTGKKNTEFRYLGWSRMPSLVRKTLICETAKNGRKRYKLTRHKENYKSGYSLASQIHAWCHKHGNCHCGTTPDFDYAF